ncbi:MAG: carbon starvation protein A, partial [Spirochaetes bacterium]|nr:carbon starvation protein A [Spirochaetota bacterium]
VLTTLDTVARLGRYAFQELFSIVESKGKKYHSIIRIFNSKATASIFTLLPAYLLAKMGYDTIWALFGAANQLLAALTLIACTLFFKKTKHYIFMLIIPTIIMLTVTYTSLVISIRSKIHPLLKGEDITQTNGIQLCIAVLLLVLGILVAVSCAIKLLEKDRKNTPETDNS